MSVPVQTRAAAQERAVRTFFMGLGLDLAVALATQLLAWLPAADLSQRAAWLILASSIAKTLLSTIGSYVLRLKLQPATEVDGAFDITTLPPPEHDRGEG